MTLPRAHLLARQVASLPGEPDTLRRGWDLVACRSLRLSTSCDHGADIGAALRSRLSPAPCHRIGCISAEVVHWPKRGLEGFICTETILSWPSKPRRPAQSQQQHRRLRRRPSAGPVQLALLL